MEVYRPSAVVLQCGADSLAGDKLGCFNITMHGHASCVQFLRRFSVPLILLGGGGYTVKNVARTWTYETACALGIENEIDPNLPWNEYFEWFGPRYRLEVPENNMDDLNVKDGSLDKVRFNALQQLSEIPCVPSVGMHDVPRESLGRHLGFEIDTDRSDSTMNDLDRRLARTPLHIHAQCKLLTSIFQSMLATYTNYKKRPHRTSLMMRDTTLTLHLKDDPESG